jgi:hypothetical protein
VTDVLPSWTDGAARQAIVGFVEQTLCRAVPVAERVAACDDDGMLWCEKPMPIQADFILCRLHEIVGCSASRPGEGSCDPQGMTLLVHTSAR